MHWSSKRVKSLNKKFGQVSHTRQTNIQSECELVGSSTSSRSKKFQGTLFKPTYITHASHY